MIMDLSRPVIIGYLVPAMATQGQSISLDITAAGASCHDSQLPPTLQPVRRQLGGLLPAGRTCQPDAGPGRSDEDVWVVLHDVPFSQVNSGVQVGSCI
jgi:hypothetical protein